MVSSVVAADPRTEADPTRPDPSRRGLGPSARAVAIALAGVSTMRATRLSIRTALLVGGSVMIAVSVAVSLWNGLGPGPLDVFIGAVRVRAGLPLGLAVWLVVGGIIAASWMLGRRPGPGTLISPLLIGPVMQITATLLHSVDVPDPIVARVVIHLVAVAGIGLGAGALIVSRLGAGSGELLAAAASDRSGRAEPRARMAIELSWLVAGVTLGGPVGVGTVLLALTIGPAVAIGHRLIDGAVVHTSERSLAYATNASLPSS